MSYYWAIEFKDSGEIAENATKYDSEYDAKMAAWSYLKKGKNQTRPKVVKITTEPYPYSKSFDLREGMYTDKKYLGHKDYLDRKDIME